MKQKVAITFESDETVVLKQVGKIATDFCPRCQRDVEMISADVLALLTGSSEREIFRLIEAGRIHFIEPHRILVCLNCFRELIAPDRQPADEFFTQIEHANTEDAK